MIDAILKAVDYIEDHIHEELSIEKISEHVLYSQFYFSRQFTSCTGLSMYDYIIKRKLTLAKEDLREGRSVTETAFKYGFGSLEHFSRYYKRYFGYKPSEISKNEKSLLDVNMLSKERLEFFSELEIKKTETHPLAFEPDIEGKDYLVIIKNHQVIHKISGFVTEKSDTSLSFTAIHVYKANQVDIPIMTSHYYKSPGVIVFTNDQKMIIGKL